MVDTSKETDERVNDIFFGLLEQLTLQWFCRYMPAWVTPDILITIGYSWGTDHHERVQVSG